MTTAIPTRQKTQAELASEWDHLAEERHHQIASGQDLSFELVVAPTALALLEKADKSLLLDVGCGTGDFTVRLAPVAKQIVAVDPSLVSIEVARKVCAATDNIRFYPLAIEEASSALGAASVTAAVAQMSLMTVRDLRQVAHSLASLLAPKARFVATIAHPCFWPAYWHYDTESWFHYRRETFIEAPFAISRHSTGSRTTHVHRPLELYLSVFAAEGFRLSEVQEPMPSDAVQALYPAPWRFPRFLGLSWQLAC